MRPARAVERAPRGRRDRLRSDRSRPPARGPFLAWIDEKRRLRGEHGIPFELILERSSKENPAKTLQPAGPTTSEDEALVLTAWATHEAFDAWIETPDGDRLTASDDHRAVHYTVRSRGTTSWAAIRERIDGEGDTRLWLEVIHDFPETSLEALHAASQRDATP